MSVIDVRGLTKRFGAVTAVDDLTKRFGAVTAVDDFSFRVGEGTVTAFLGPNGAGKPVTGLRHSLPGRGGGGGRR